MADRLRVGLLGKQNEGNAMPTPYHIALLLSRLFGCMGVASGLVQIVVAVVVAEFFVDGSQLQGLPFMLLSYGLFQLTGGITILLVSKWIAGFAAKFE
jgi:hypothetical protein